MNARVDPEGQTKAGGPDLRQHIVEAVGGKAHHVQDGSEVLGVEIGDGGDFNQRGADVPTLQTLRNLALVDEMFAIRLDVGRQACERRFVDYGPDVGLGVRGVSDNEGLHGLRDHCDQALRDFFLHVKYAQGRASLPRGAESGCDHIVYHLFGQRRRIYDHGVLTTGFRNERDDGTVLCRERALNLFCGRSRPGEGNAGNGVARHDFGADFVAATGQADRSLRDPGFAHQFGRRRGDGRRLRRGLGDDGVARRQCRRHLAGEDGERKVPRRNAGKYAPSMEHECVGLSGDSIQQVPRAEQALAFAAVVAAEVGGFSDLRHRIVKRLARFSREHRNESGTVFLDQVRELLQPRSSICRGSRLPCLESAGCSRGEGPNTFSVRGDGDLIAFPRRVDQCQDLATVADVQAR